MVLKEEVRLGHKKRSIYDTLFIERETNSFICHFTESNLLNKEDKLSNMNRGRSASLHSMRGFGKIRQNTEEPSLPPFFLCVAILFDRCSEESTGKLGGTEEGKTGQRAMSQIQTCASCS